MSDPTPTTDEVIARLEPPQNLAEQFILQGLRRDVENWRKAGLSEFQLWSHVFDVVTTVERYREFGNQPIIERLPE